MLLQNFRYNFFELVDTGPSNENASLGYVIVRFTLQKYIKMGVSKNE